MAPVLYPSLIPKYSVGLRLRDGEPVEVLGPGRVPFRLRRMFSDRERIEVLDTWATQLKSRDLEAWVRLPALADRLEIVRLGASERAIVWREDQLYATLGPGLYAFWREPARIRIDRYDLSKNVRLDMPGVERLWGSPALSPFVKAVRTSVGFMAAVFVDGALVDMFDKGTRVYWRTEQAWESKLIDMRERTADVSSQDIMTRDKVSLRTSLVVSWKVRDVKRVLLDSADIDGSVYREAQLALRAVIGTRTLDQLLADKDLVNERVFEMLAARASELGAEILRVGIKDFILPGDMKAILNQVITATKEAEANMIRRREETAAARSQANTAKLLAANPVLTRMRELEALGDVLRGMKATFVLGPGDIAGQVTRLVTQDASKDSEA